MKLIVGDQDSIDYAYLKRLESLKVFRFHECSCDRCEWDGGKCPHCDHEMNDWDDPEIDWKNARSYAGLCPECGEHFLTGPWELGRIKNEIEKLENKKSTK